jgi:DNA-binding MarR family transcriptional regulator
VVDSRDAALETIMVSPGIPLAISGDARQRSYPRPSLIKRESAMDEPLAACELTAAERQLIRLLRHGPQSVKALAEALRLSPEQTQDVLQSLDRKAGIVRLFRYDTLRYGLVE